MKIITEYIGKKRTESLAHTEYTAMVKFIVSDLEAEDGITWEQWVIDNFMYIPVEIMADMMGLEIPSCECCGNK